MHLYFVRRSQLAALVSVFILFIQCLVVWLGEPSTPANTDGVKLPILMYHQVLKTPQFLGAYVVSPQELEKDFQYLKEKGYTAVSVREVIDFVNEGAPLPEKPIMITFDDGHLSFNEYVLPLLEEYDLRAVLSVVGAYTDEYTENQDRHVTYAYLNWQDLCNLEKSGRVDLGNHTYNLHQNGKRQGSMQRKGESDAEYQSMLKADLSKLQEAMEQHGLKEPLCYTYPFGFISKSSQRVIEELGFQMSLGCAEGVNRLYADPACLFELKRYNRPHGKNARTILEGK
ncbi:MAG: polysaccharide deacetylase family protein [Clostridia bacterium]|nr:polysaccharide deacetylase family protein [Clostridia bacterium]